MMLTALQYTALSAVQKEQVILQLGKHLQETAAAFTFRQKALAQGLFLTRLSQTFAQLLGLLDLPLPALSADLLELVWQYLLEERSARELEPDFRAADSVVTCLMTGDDEDLDETAWEKYQAEWDNRVYFDCCLSSAEGPCYLLDDIVSGEASWSLLTSSALLDSLGGFISDFDLDPVFKTANGVYHGREIVRHYQEIYDSPTFAALFGALQEDLRTAEALPAPSGRELYALRERYREKLLFAPEQLQKIAERLKAAYKL